MSFRSAQDYTYVAQLLGRMVRTPLAHRIEMNAKLNAVHLFLPFFNKEKRMAEFSEKFSELEQSVSEQ